MGVVAGSDGIKGLAREIASVEIRRWRRVISADKPVTWAICRDGSGLFGYARDAVDENLHFSLFLFLL